MTDKCENCGNPFSSRIRVEDSGDRAICSDCVMNKRIFLLCQNCDEFFVPGFRALARRLYPTCPKCKKPATMKVFLESEVSPDEQAEVKKRLARKRRQDKLRSGLKAKEYVGKLILTTSHFLDGYRVTETLDIVTAECVLGMNFFRDLFAAVSDIVGGRSLATQKELKNAKEICLNELRMEAKKLGAQAVIGVNLSYSQLSGQAKSMVMLVASGTAVKIRREEPRTQSSEDAVILAKGIIEED